jgi:TIGR03009 family protein
MRFFALLIAWCVAASALAQAPGKSTSNVEPARPEMTANAKQTLDAYLKLWDARMSKIQGLETKIKLTEVDEDKRSTVYSGEAAFLKPNCAKLDIKNEAKPDEAKQRRHYLVDGKFFWDYSHHRSVITRNPIPKEGLSNIPVMQFLLGAKADDIKKRYDLFIDPDDKTKLTEHYIFITIYPKLKSDQQDFAKAELVLWISKDEKFASKKMLPARLWFMKENKEHQMWEFPGIGENTDLKEASFKAFLPTKDWKVEDGAKK